MLTLEQFADGVGDPTGEKQRTQDERHKNAVYSDLLPAGFIYLSDAREVARLLHSNIAQAIVEKDPKYQAEWIEYQQAAMHGRVEDALAAHHPPLIRDIFGTPSRSRVRAKPTWLTDTVVTLARQMYDSRDFTPVPILADALQDAGCDNADVLDHCRGDGPHVRGCWVVDLLLGKS